MQLIDIGIRPTKDIKLFISKILQFEQSMSEIFDE